MDLPKELRPKDKILTKKNGYHLARVNGSHYIDEKEGVKNNITLNKDIHPPVWRRLIKENNLIV